MKTIFKLYLLTILTAFSFGQIDDGCDLPDLNLYLTSDGSVLYNSSSAIGGFQFNVDGATVAGGSGGDAAAAGFVVSAGGSTALGFSFTGSTIPAGCGTLVDLDIVGTATGLSGIVMSDAVGNPLDFSYYEGGDIQLDCEDESACNFLQPGDCEYPQENYDCDGNCAVDIDCNGDCGGDAVIDECGVCDGDGTSCETFYLDISYSSDQDIAGFQFDVDGATIVSAAVSYTHLTLPTKA